MGQVLEELRGVHVIANALHLEHEMEFKRGLIANRAIENPAGVARIGGIVEAPERKKRRLMKLKRFTAPQNGKAGIGRGGGRCE